MMVPKQRDSKSMNKREAKYILNLHYVADISLSVILKAFYSFFLLFLFTQYKRVSALSNEELKPNVFIITWWCINCGFLLYS